MTVGAGNGVTVFVTVGAGNGAAVAVTVAVFVVVAVAVTVAVAVAVGHLCLSPVHGGLLAEADVGSRTAIMIAKAAKATAANALLIFIPSPFAIEL